MYQVTLIQVRQVCDNLNCAMVQEQIVKYISNLCNLYSQYYVSINKI